MYKVKIRPLSVNKAWKGRRFKTDDYKRYEQTLMYLLPPISNLSEGQLELNLTFGFSSRASDLSNPLKMTEDILTKKYGFNDNRIYRIVMEKKIVSKGEEYLQFLIKKYEQKE